MMSGRGLGHTGGTLDKLEAIPGFRVGLRLDEFRAALRDVGCALIGQTSEIAPADKKLYALRDVTATVESIPLITASIMSKKVAEGIDALVLDVKCGRGAFMKGKENARSLAEALVATGTANGVRTEALITAMDAPLGRAVGNALEVKECFAVLRGEGPRDVEDLSVALAAHMVMAGGVARSLTEAEDAVRSALMSGAGLAKLRRVIERQGGDPRVVDDPKRLPTASRQSLIRARRTGYVSAIDAEEIGRATMLLGAGRECVDDVIDPAVGVVIKVQIGECVQAGDALVEVHYNSEQRWAQARALLQTAWSIADTATPPQALILDSIECFSSK
jgi:pyrimidine-nucleoside phosphorylase